MTASVVGAVLGGGTKVSVIGAQAKTTAEGEARAVNSSEARSLGAGFYPTILARGLKSGKNDLVSIRTIQAIAPAVKIT
jgi:hypothetical protein